MRLVVSVGFAVLTMVNSSIAAPRPPQISWDWYNTAEVYKRYPHRTNQDLKIAAKYYALSARKGNSAAAYKLGEMYENGIGVNKNYQAALKWYQSAADVGDKYAEFRIGWFHQYGLGTKANMVDARIWYERSAKQDNEWAYHMLAFMFADGSGVKRDPIRAREYFEISLPRTNDSWAKWKYATLIEKSNPKRAKLLLLESAGDGNIEAQKELLRKVWSSAK